MFRKHFLEKLHWRTKLTLQGIAQEAMAKFHMPAVSITILNAKDITNNVTIGKRIYDQEEEVTVDDFFHVGSCSKSILSFIAAKLIEQKQLTWNTRFFDVFPELEKDAKQAYINITLADLLLSRAGIKSFTHAKEEPLPQFLKSDGTEDIQFLHYLVTQNPATKYKNGTFKFLYSNASYVMASAMLQKTSNLPYPEMIDLHLHKNLSIPFHIGWPVSYGQHQPWGHMIDGKKIEKFGPDNEYTIPSLIAPAGALSFQPKNFARYVQLHLQGLMGMDNYLTANSYQKIALGEKGFSMGMVNGSFSTMKFVGFDGSAGTFYCRGMIFPESDFAFIILTNSGSSTGSMKAIDWLTKKIVIHKYELRGLKKILTWFW